MEESDGPPPVVEDSGQCGTGMNGLFCSLPSPLVSWYYFLVKSAHLWAKVAEEISLNKN